MKRPDIQADVAEAAANYSKEYCKQNIDSDKTPIPEQVPLSKFDMCVLRKFQDSLDQYRLPPL